MNTVHCIVWSDSKQAWMVAHEAAKTKGKPGASRSGTAASALMALLLTAGMSAQAAPPIAVPAVTTLPTGGQVVAGQATIGQSGSGMDVNQTTNKAILNWNSFSIGSGAQVNFKQPSSSAVALNRVLGSDPSAIYGSLTANGQVFLVNPNGVLFGRGARVDVGGLVASSMGISNADFLNGNNRFTRDGSTASVVNEGSLYAKYVALLAPEVRNSGLIAASMGTVALAAGEAVTLNISGQNLVDVQVDAASIATLVENRQLIQADDGTVILSAQAASGLMSRVVNSGAIEANGITQHGGSIYLSAGQEVAQIGSLSANAGTQGDGGRITVLASLANPGSLALADGSISAQGGTLGGNGGQVETSGSHLQVADSLRVNTSAVNGQSGNWLLDPNDFTVAASGGNSTGSAIAVNLRTTDVTIATASQGTAGGNGDIFVNDSINVTGANGAHSLTLLAERNIAVASGVSISSTGVGNALNVVLNSRKSPMSADGSIALGAGSSIASNGGNIVMGVGCNTSGCTAPAIGNGAAGTAAIGLNGASGNVVSLSSAGGLISLWGQGGVNGGAGISMSYANIDSGAAGSVSVRGDGWYSNSANGHGVNIANSTLRGGSGGMTLKGNSSVNNTGQWSFPLYFDASSAYTTNGGTLAVLLNSNQNSGNNHYLVGSGTFGNAALQNGDISFTWSGTAALDVSLPNIEIPVGNLIINSHRGLAANSNTQNVAGSTTINGGGTGFDVALGTSGAFNGGTVSVTNARNVSVVDADTLTLGAFSSIAGTVYAATTVGNLTVSQNIATTDASVNAITLNAGKAAAAGIASGGNILITGVPTFSTGTNGRTTLMSGAISGSTGLSTLVGSGSGRFRYKSDEVTTSYSTALGSGTYAIYREQPLLSVTPGTASTLYGDAVSVAGVTATVAGYANGDNAGTAPSTGTASYTTAATSSSHVGSYNIAYASGLSNALGYGYTDAAQTGEYSVTARPVTVTVANQSRVYGDANPNTGTIAATVGGSGFVFGDGISALNVAAPSMTGTTNAGSTGALVGSNPTLTVGSNASSLNDYAVTIASGTLAVNKATLTATADDKSRVYGDANPALSVSYSGLKNGDTATVIDAAPVASTAATAASNVGSYAIALAGGTDNNYTITPVAGILAVSKATLTATADDKGRVYGDANPALTVSYTGFKNGDTATVIDAAPVASTAATAASNVGSYAIALAGGADNNYELTLSKGNLLVNALPAGANPGVTTLTIYQTAAPSPAQPGVPPPMVIFQGQGGILFTAGIFPTANVGSALPQMLPPEGTVLAGTGDSIIAVSGVSPAIEMKNRGFTATELKPYGFTASDLKGAGFTASELKKARYLLTDIKAAGYSADTLKAAEYSAADLKKVGYSATDLKGGGYRAADLKNAGYSAADLKKAGYSMNDLKREGYRAAALRNAEYSAADLKNIGFSLNDLKDGGYSATNLKAAGYSAADLKNVGYPVADLKEAGYSANDLKGEGYPAADLRNAGYSAADLKNVGFSLDDLRDGGYSATNLKAAGYSAVDLKRAHYSVNDLKDGGYLAAELLNAGYSAAELLNAGYLAAKLKAAKH